MEKEYFRMIWIIDLESCSFSKFFTKLASSLTKCVSLVSQTMHIFFTLKEKKLTVGKKPDSVASAVIYMAGIKTGVNLSQQKISKVSGITVVTIRNRYKEYIKHVELI